MISHHLAEALNRQMNNEFNATQAYMAMAAYCEHRNYGEFANFHLQQVEEELATISFLRWFLDEHVEEEATFDTHIEYLKRIGEDKNALFLYEKELGQRVFSPEN